MTRKKVYITNLIIVTGFTVIYYLTGQVMFLLPAALVLIFSFRFSFAEKIALTWMKTGKTIGNFNASILLVVVYLLLVIPTGLVKKLAAKPNKERGSNWRKAGAPVDFTKPF